MGTQAMVLGSAPWTKASLVAVATGTGSSSSSIATSAMTAVTGNFLIAFVRFNGQQLGITPSITDTASNGYSQLANGIVIDDSAGGSYYPEMYSFYKANATGNASNVVTCTFSGGSPVFGSEIIVLQYSGIATSSPLIEATTLNDSGGTRTTHTFTAPFATSLGGVSIAGIFTSAGSYSWTPTNGYTSHAEVNVTNVASRRFPAGVSTVYTPTFTSTAAQSAGIAGLFKVA